MRTLTIYFAGHVDSTEARGHIATWSYVLRDPDDPSFVVQATWDVGGISPSATTAAYVGLGRGVSHAIAAGMRPGAVQLIGDDRAAVDQLKGRGDPPKGSPEHGMLVAVRQRLRELGVPDVRLQWVPREQNLEAVALCLASWEGTAAVMIPGKREAARRVQAKSAAGA